MRTVLGGAVLCRAALKETNDHILHQPSWGKAIDTRSGESTEGMVRNEHEMT